jgi:hypothetical protein
MSLITYEYINRQELKVTYLAPKIIPTTMFKPFIEAFVEEKLSLGFLSQQHVSLIGSSVISNLAGPELDSDMCDTWAGVRFVLEVFYYDSVNYRKKTTQFAFRMGTYVDFSKIDLPDLDDTSLNIHGEKLCDDLFLVYSNFISDPNFKMDKIRLYICFVPIPVEGAPEEDCSELSDHFNPRSN